MSSPRRQMPSLSLCLAVLVLPAGGRIADAQTVRGDVAVSAGSATDQRGVHSTAFSIAPSVLIAPDPRFSAGLAASVTQFGANARAVGGSATLGARVPLGSVVAFAASATGSSTQTTFNASYASADMTPTLEATIAGVTLFGGVHVASGVSTLRAAAPGAGGIPGALPGTPAGTRDVTTSRGSSGPVIGGVVNLAGATGGAISYREEHARVDGLRVVDRVATGRMTSGAAVLSASAGVRDAADERLGFGSVGAALAIGRGVALQGALGTYPSNRLTGTFGGRFATLGVMLQGARRLDAPPDRGIRIRGVPAAPPGVTRLAITAPSASRVEVAGDWNSWTPTAVARAPDGTWYADIRLAAGQHAYAFKLDGKRWTVPDGVASVDDGFGGRSALVTVR